MNGAIWHWFFFYLLISLLFVIDIGIFNKKNQKISIKRSLMLSGFYISTGMIFGLFIWSVMGSQGASEYYTGYLIEKILSIDNLFVITLIFSALKIEEKYQYRVLFWGLTGVMVTRIIMISIGTSLVHRFEWILYIFSGFLILTGIKMFTQIKKNNKDDISNHFILKFLKKNIPHTDDIDGNKFFIKKVDEKTKIKKIFATPLFLALIFIEIIDLIFAIDSLPAIFAITSNKYIIYTSNIFAILGLRSLYFAISGVINKFEYLKYFLALLLIFIGSKIFIVKILGIEKFPAGLSFLITFLFLFAGIIFSFYKEEKKIS